MSTYLVFQPELSPVQIDLINRHGWGAHPALEAYASMSLCNLDNAQLRADEATHQGLYQFNYIVDTDNLDTLFDACNDHSKEGDVVRKLRSGAKSMSVGDLVMDAWGGFHLCCGLGWQYIDASIKLKGCY